LSLPASTTSALDVPAATDARSDAMAAWSGRGSSKGHDLPLGLLRISNTDQTYRGCGSCWQVCAEHSNGDDANHSLRYGERVQLASAARQSHAAIILAAAGE
jgi:cytidine deaminase